MFLSFNSIFSAEFHPSPCCSTHDDSRPCHTVNIKYNPSPPTFPPLFVLYSDTDVHTVASLLKLYLRELPEPVIPFHKYDDFLTCAKLLGKDDETVRKSSWLPINCLSCSLFLCIKIFKVQIYTSTEMLSKKPSHESSCSVTLTSHRLPPYPLHKTH